MDVLSSFFHFGVKVAMNPMNLAYCFAGVLFGTFVGVLPGIGPMGGIALLLPLTFVLPPTSGIIMLAGLYCGVMYGGSTTSILVNIPGETASIVTCIDGHEMAKQGRAGPALGIAAMGSWIGGTFGLIMLMFLSYQLSIFALKFGPPEYFALMATGLIFLTCLSSAPAMKTWVMIFFGLILGTVGLDEITGILRFDLGIPQLSDGIQLIPLAMGLFGISEIMINLEKPVATVIYKARIKNLLPNRKDWKRALPAITRGTFLGFFIGLFPGGSGVLSSFASYALEKKVGRYAQELGKGAIEGVAGPETANNSATAGAFVPFLSFGIPSNGTMALMLGALMVHGIVPGPLLIQDHPDLFWGVIGSMYLANIMLVILNLPLIGLWVRMLKVPYKILFPLILLFCILGTYSSNYSVFDLYCLVFFGILGYLLRKFQYPMAPLILARVLGPRVELAFFQTMIISDGQFTVFFKRPIACVVLFIGLLLLFHSLYKDFRGIKGGLLSSGNEIAYVEDDEI